ncbi:MAG: hypothetical protein MJ016_07590 [Victivallaceae bacterium]|nr:hypothetical protein [Victivallaceae bacterium]
MSGEAIFSASGRSDRIIGYNNAGPDLDAACPVGIGRIVRQPGLLENAAQVPLIIQPTTRDTTTIGVTLEKIPRGAYGEVQISGAAPCRIRGGVSGNPCVLAGADGGLVGAPYGWPILSVCNSDLAVILLGGSYRNFSGSFAVVVRDGEFFCCDTKNPESGIAGTTDLGDVPAGRITPSGNEFRLFAWYDGEEYHQSFSRPACDAYGIVTLADLVNGIPLQRWTQGMIHWGQWYFL